MFYINSQYFMRLGGNQFNSITLEDNVVPTITLITVTHCVPLQYKLSLFSDLMNVIHVISVIYVI